ncbi:MAG: hypothetical protein WCF33_06015 [Pseudonocardiaceae bacterium]
MPARRGVQELLTGMRERRPEPVVRRRRDNADGGSPPASAVSIDVDDLLQEV